MEIFTKQQYLLKKKNICFYKKKKKITNNHRLDILTKNVYSYFKDFV